jgi:hypothetical protein
MLLQTLSTLSLLAAPSVGSSEHRLIGGVVEAVERAEFGSGVLKAWHRIEVRPPSGPNLTLSSLSLSGDEPLPTPGQVCLFSYHAEGLGGRHGRAIIDTTACDPLAGSQSARER